MTLPEWFSWQCFGIGLVTVLAGYSVATTISIRVSRQNAGVNWGSCVNCCVLPFLVVVGALFVVVVEAFTPLNCFITGFTSGALLRSLLTQKGGTPTENHRARPMPQFPREERDRGDAARKEGARKRAVRKLGKKLKDEQPSLFEEE